MSEEIKPVKSERIDNPDGSYILKEIYDEAPDGILSVVIYVDKKNRLVKIQEFFDKEFKNLFITETRKYDIFNNWVSVVVETDNSVWAKRYYKKGKLVKEKRYDKDSNKILSIIKYKYYKNGHYKTFNKNYTWDNGRVTEKEYNENNELICKKYLDRGFTKYYKNYVKIKILYEYENGEIVKERIFENNKEIPTNETKPECKYDSQNRLIEEKTMFGDEINYFKKIEYLENGHKIIYESFRNGDPVEKYNSRKEERDENGKLVYGEYYKDRDFKELLYTEKREYISDKANISYIRFVNPQRGIQSYINERNNGNTKITYYEDKNFEKIYAIDICESNNFGNKYTIQLEKPLNSTFELYLIPYEISIEWLSCEKISSFSNNPSLYTFYANKNFKEPICYSKQKYLKDGYTALFYNVYPKENYVEVRRYYDDKLIYKKQYKKFKFLAKLRFNLGI